MECAKNAINISLGFRKSHRAGQVREEGFDASRVHCPACTVRPSWEIQPWLPIARSGFFCFKG